MLFVVCVGTEFWYLSLYLLAFTDGPAVLGVPAVKLLFLVCTPFSIFKQVANAVQMYVACESLVELDNIKRSKK